MRHEDFDALLQRVERLEARIAALEPKPRRVRYGWRQRPPSPGGLQSLVFRTTRDRYEGLAQLVARTRISWSELLREAIADVLAKHSA